MVLSPDGVGLGYFHRVRPVSHVQHAFSIPPRFLRYRLAFPSFGRGGFGIPFVDI